ncbi:hypothetical protein N9B35_00890, partial [bacterium]|nr:hypothetical protein [bacterium]
MSNSESNRSGRTSRVFLVVATVAFLSGIAFFVWPDTPESPTPPNVQITAQPGTIAWPAPASLSSASHQRMVDELAGIAQSTPEDNIWLGDKHARKLRADLASLPAGTSHVILGGIKSQLAKAELNLGNESEAIRLLTECDTIHLRQISSEWPVAQARALAISLRFELGVAHLRLGETQNCCQRNTPDSCIMPIQGTGIHQNVAGSRNAIAYFSSVLKYSAKDSEHHLRARWLLNIAYMTIGAHPAEVPKEHLISLEKLMPGAPFPRFANIAKKA